MNFDSFDISLLFLGTEGLSMIDDAMDTAAKMLGTMQIESHPDYIYLDVCKGKKSIGVAEISPLIDKGSRKPILARKSVAVINHMELLTEQAQNKLLRLLEQNENLLIIGVAYADTLLSTVKSRMLQVPFSPLGKKAFLELYGKYSNLEASLLYCASGGCPGTARHLLDELPFFVNLYSACSGEEPHRILEVLHLVREKDSLALHERPELIEPSFRVLQYRFMEQTQYFFDQKDFPSASKYLNLVRFLADSEAEIRDGRSKKEQLFYIICCCIESLSQ